MKKKETTLKELLELDNYIGLFDNIESDFDSFTFADDVPAEFIELLKKKQRIGRQFQGMLDELKKQSEEKERLRVSNEEKKH